jgi:hypothetical protein
LQGYSTRVPEALEQSSEAQKVCSRGKDTGSEKKVIEDFCFFLEKYVQKGTHQTAGRKMYLLTSVIGQKIMLDP